jgi:ubiquinone/menaquinone biosynthesis C-methylase UbiE
MTLGEAWREHSAKWLRWAREPGHDSYWTFHREAFLPSLPPPGRLTLDIGCGEGRLTRDLTELGHRVVGIDQSEMLIRAAREADPDGDYRPADAAELPFADGEADLAIAFMSLMDMDDMPAVLRELARVLEPGGRLVATVVHPLNSASFPREHGRHRLVIADYRKQRRYSDTIERDGLEMTFESFHYSLEDYWRAIRHAGFVVEDLRELYDDEHPVWSTVPLFLGLDGRKTR